MANPNNSVRTNAPGDFFVDTGCINCGVSRHYAPEIFGDDGAYAYVKRQPASAQEVLDAELALLACPVAAIGTWEKHDLARARDAFPFALTDEVYVNGFNDRSSYGAHSYFIHGRSDGGSNWMIDAPRFTKHLVSRIEALGGLDYIFLTHRDDVSDAAKYAAQFGAQRIIHTLERQAQPDAEMILEGEGEHDIGGARILFTPGHTQGHMVLLWRDRSLFVGDHLAGRAVCWYSWPEQIASTAKLDALADVDWVFPGHGKWFPVTPGGFPEFIRARVRKMRAAG